MCFCRLEIIHSYNYFFTIILFFRWNWWGRPSLRKRENVWNLSLPSVCSQTPSDSHITTGKSRTLESTSYHLVNPPINLMVLDLSWGSEYRTGVNTIFKLQEASAQGRGQLSRKKEGWYVSRNQKRETCCSNGLQWGNTPWSGDFHLVSSHSKEFTSAFLCARHTLSTCLFLTHNSPFITEETRF